MKKLLIVSTVFILLAVSAMPVMAGNGSPNGHGNGVGQGNGGGNQNQNKDKEHGRSRDKERNSQHGMGKFKNQDNNKWKYTPFYVQGVISAVDAGAMTITVNVTHANAKAKNYIGTDMVIYANESTLLHVVNQGEDNGDDNGDGDGEGNSAKVPISFDQLAVGQRVAVHGRLTDTAANTSVFMARLVTVYLGAPEGQPSEP